MTHTPAVTKAVIQLQELSAVAHREAEQVLPVIVPHGEAVTLQWLAACVALCSF